MGESGPSERVLLETPVGWGLGGARRALRRAAILAGLEQTRVDDLVIAANEVLTNALIHGGGAASVKLALAGDVLTCEVGDAGGGFAASTGRQAPDPRGLSQGGMGLWLVRRLCDDVRIDHGSAGTTVTMEMRLSAAPSHT